MENDIKKLKIDYYVKLVLKKRWWIIVPFCISLAIGLCLAILLPKVYSASNLILVVPKSVPDKYVPNVLTTDVQERINTIKLQIMSRSNVSKMIEELDLFKGPEYEHMYLIDKIEAIRKNTYINVTKSRSGIESFIIEFRGADPQKIAEIVNNLADSFIDESTRLIEAEVMETNKFLSDELEGLRNQLEKIETDINQYRQNHLGELPEELQSNLSTLERLQLQLSEKQENIRDAKNRLIVLENRIGLEKENIERLNDLNKGMNDISLDVVDFGETPSAELEKLKKVLAELEMRYTDKHPDVIRIRSMIKAMENTSKESDGDKEVEMAAGPDDIDLALTAASPVSLALMELTAKRDEIQDEIARYQQEIGGIENRIEEYQRRVENTPKREQDLTALQRNYANIQRSYNSLLDRKLQSDIAVNVERKQKGEKFRVVDRAEVPQKPISPKMKLLFLASIAAGLGIGFGVIFLLDFLDNTFKVPDDIENSLGVHLLCTIPEVHRKADKIRYRINEIMSIFALMFSFGLLLVFAVISSYGVERTLSFVKQIFSPA